MLSQWRAVVPGMREQRLRKQFQCFERCKVLIQVVVVMLAIPLYPKLDTYDTYDGWR